MPWSTTRKPGTDPKYRSREHRVLRAALVRQINAGEALECQAKHCVFDRMPITNPNGNDPDGLNLGHEDNGIDYRGPEHRACNIKDGAQRGNARSKDTKPTTAEPRRWIL